jgi:hypothetical protein
LSFPRERVLFLCRSVEFGQKGSKKLTDRASQTENNYLGPGNIVCEIELGILAAASVIAPSDAYIGVHVWFLCAELANKICLLQYGSL